MFRHGSAPGLRSGCGSSGAALRVRHPTAEGRGCGHGTRYLAQQGRGFTHLPPGPHPLQQIFGHLPERHWRTDCLDLPERLLRLGMLQVLPKAERRGLGGLLAAAMTRRIARDEDVTLTAWIVATNWRSEALLKRIGYRKELDNEWIKLVPNPNPNPNPNPSVGELHIRHIRHIHHK
ncbi:hypothetical protein M5D96_013749 [Drosophila gunungcola]|uniref:GCN5-related N-acetyltransferase Rv2170-like domain-containing protein n=1 Tax=Drosophila gunungcola TaxID=103775 RepID=A0A9Q0BIK6_9MUSC|nr:hypothetical protein M5D96_013749 [Drosophila gunungcola]